ncbi:S8 family serine peptidase [uncultured Kocuria sp.]|uniref:S8 family serine peptidase n=1 Tax=uncultured Kocuria sp. TaxID=259305 RepID=UPI0026291B5F|nr:S8 family serine peptidase [uncultured Kocuria sp.]
MTTTRSTTVSLALAAALALVPLGSAAAESAAAPPAAQVPQPVPQAAGAAPGAASGAGPVGATDRVVVKFRDGAVPEDSRDVVYAQAAGRSGDAGLEETAATADGAQVVRTGEMLAGAELEALTTALEQDPAVEYAEPDLLATTAAVPNDPSYATLQWSLWDDPAGLGMPLAWDRATGAGQTIAVVDTGITSHPDLDANVLPGYDFVSTAQNGRDGDGWDADATDMGDHPDAVLCPNSPMPPTSTWHGTHTAGVAAADANNGLGISGVAPDAKILPVRAVGACSQGYITDVAAGILWASGAPVAGAAANPNPATVINLSLGVPGECPAVLQSAISEALGRGIPVVAAAGNQSMDAAQSAPANCAGVISVAATDVAGALAPYSNFGSVTLAAPGGDPYAQILSTGNAGAQGLGAPTYTERNGTSMAAPAVSGAVALLRELSPGLGVAGLRDALTSTARQAPGGCAPGCGAGIMDPVSALVAVQGGEPFTTRGGIGALHRKIGTTTGEARSRELCALGGTPCFQEFANGWIIWNTGLGARWHQVLPLRWWETTSAR